MNLVDVALVIGRRWYVFVLVLAVACAGFAVLDDRGGLYASKPVIQFMRPGAGSLQIYNGLDDEDIIGFAQTVAEAVNNGRPVEHYAMDDAPLYGAGVQEAVRVGVPSTGGQWGTSFDRAEIAISIVGSSRAWVEARQDALVSRVLDSARTNQDALGTPRSARVSYSILPASTTIEHVTGSRSSRAAALVALLAAGTLVGGWIAVVLDRQVVRRGRGAGRHRVGAPGGVEGGLG